jgi:hypothetical protein
MCNVAMVQSVFVRQQTCSLLKRLGARMLVSAVASYRLAANRRARMGEAGEMAAADWPAEVTRTKEVCIYGTSTGVCYRCRACVWTGSFLPIKYMRTRVPIWCVLQVLMTVQLAAQI